MTWATTVSGGGYLRNKNVAYSGLDSKACYLIECSVGEENSVPLTWNREDGNYQHINKVLPTPIGAIDILLQAGGTMNNSRSR